MSMSSCVLLNMGCQFLSSENEFLLYLETKQPTDDKEGSDGSQDEFRPPPPCEDGEDSVSDGESEAGSDNKEARSQRGRSPNQAAKRRERKLRYPLPRAKLMMLLGEFRFACPRSSQYSTFAKSHISFQISYRPSNWRNAFGTSAANAVKTYIESNPDGMFTNESEIAEFVQLYTDVQQTPPTVPFH